MSDEAENSGETPAPLSGPAAAFAPAVAPSGEDFLAIAEAAYAGLPEAFRALCGNMVIQVTDFADETTLKYFAMDNPYELTGLYHGVDLTQKSIADPHDGPDYVFLYRLPILLEWCERGDVTLRELIAHVLVHEIGHHFGLSDDDMHAIEDAAD
ncbi:metallopeptidase family protein [Alkalicaulis satelles]|uniref:Metallopeptidase family protein n=1 Tax=Alkalicaulis satelles TaxID=2609175 RepID=A0A5M6ZCV3_9PROT|nr:metallopeptidase family protein [Alkalicaulis satelles]KAA5800908.1 metallopeptidase family protein [Alkalicaulis satelles]